MLITEAKILERVVYAQLLEHVDKNNILTRYQSGFRKQFSCETAVQCVLNDWKENLDKDLITVAVFIHLKRAFETVDREILLIKLENLEIGGEVYQWFKSYLRQRVQNVKCGIKISENRNTVHGIPQGSVLGPLLSVMYINDIGDCIQHAKYHLFADDMVVYITGNDITDLMYKLDEDTRRITNWLDQNRLKVNVEKTKMMLFRNKIVQLGNTSLEINNQKVDIVESIKYLGIIIDRKLNFSEHIDYISKKIAKKLGVLRRCSHYLSVWTRKTIYNSIILPHFQYASTILYLANKEDMNRLKLLQNRAMQIILGCNRYARIADMLKQLGWVSVEKMIRVNVLIFLHKIRLGLMPEYLSEHLKQFSEVQSYGTRGKDNFILDHKNSKAAQNSIFFKGLVEYNDLSKRVKDISNVRKFKLSIMSRM